jgi:hypothetical protein
MKRQSIFRLALSLATNLTCGYAMAVPSTILGSTEIATAIAQSPTLSAAYDQLASEGFTFQYSSGSSNLYDGIDKIIFINNQFIGNTPASVGALGYELASGTDHITFPGPTHFLCTASPSQAPAYAQGYLYQLGYTQLVLIRSYFELQRVGLDGEISFPGTPAVIPSQIQTYQQMSSSGATDEAISEALAPSIGEEESPIAGVNYEQYFEASFNNYCHPPHNDGSLSTANSNTAFYSYLSQFSVYAFDGSH